MRQRLTEMTSILELKISEQPGGHLSAAIIIDGIRFGEDCIDLSDLKRSAIASGAYDLQTCGCGTPQCAGFWEPIFVQHDSEIVRWEFDSRYHPIVQEDDGIKFSLGCYEFSRMQYIKEIQRKFEWLRGHPNRDSLGPHGFDAAIFDEEFPDTSILQLPFESGSTIVVGYLGEYRQPWIWVEENSDLYPRQLLPTGSMWAKFGYWSLMWNSELYDLGQCAYKKDSLPFQLRSDVTVLECNQEVDALAREVKLYWGDPVKVIYEKIQELAHESFKRCDLKQ